MKIDEFENFGQSKHYVGFRTTFIFLGEGSEKSKSELQSKDQQSKVSHFFSL